MKLDFKSNGVFINIFLISILLSGFIFWLKYPSNFDMNGNLVEVKENSIVMRGIFEGEVKETKIFEIGIDMDTKITRVSFVIPEGEGMYKPAELPKQESSANLEIMKVDMENTTVGLEKIRLKKNILGKPKMVAEEIRYLVPEY